MQRAFTLVEIIVVVALFTIIVGLGLFATIGMFESQLSRSDRDTLVSELELARGNAMANLDQKTWGVCYDGANYVVFEGAYVANAATNQLTPVSSGVTVSSTGNAFQCSAGGVVFAQLSGSASAVTTITVVQNGTAQTIATNNEGTIIW